MCRTPPFCIPAGLDDANLPKASPERGGENALEIRQVSGCDPRKCTFSLRP